MVSSDANEIQQFLCLLLVDRSDSRALVWLLRRGGDNGCGQLVTDEAAIDWSGLLLCEGDAHEDVPFLQRIREEVLDDSASQTSMDLLEVGFRPFPGLLTLP